MPKPKTEPSSKEKEVLDTLRVFEFHGLHNLTYRQTADDATADCPFCGKEGKFGIHIATTKWQCFVCGAGGNEITFVRNLWDHSWEESEGNKDYTEFTIQSSLVFPSTPRDWHVCKHSLTGEWCIAGYNVEGKITGLYRWVNIKDSKGKWKRVLLPSPRLGHHLFGFHLYQKHLPTVFICEGWRDPMVLWETIKILKEHTDVQLAAEANVLGIPGTNSFKADWAPLFAGKRVVLMFDNDYPVTNPKTGKETLVGGAVGVQRTASILASQAEELRPASIEYLSWGAENHEGFNRKLANGTDIRDIIGGADAQTTKQSTNS